MNEFTKEELHQLSFAIYTYPHPDDDHIYDGLRKKIKTMIDNYCEHELSSPLLALVKECSKCNIVLAHRRWELSEWK